MNVSILKDRASQFAKMRDFFASRSILEVDCPMLTTGAPIDLHIDLFKVDTAKHPPRYLHSSPEYCMKRLLSQGCGDIYQLGHVFRSGEYGKLHNPEFTMAEWYRLGFSFQQMIDETVEFVKIFLNDLPVEQITYRNALLKYAGLDYVHATEKELLELLHKKNISTYQGIELEGKDALLNLLLAELVEPELGKESITVLSYYPSSQAALACIVPDGDSFVAERFEVFYKGIELANGYHELTDPVEQRNRFEQANRERIHHGKESLPIDEFFIKALSHGIPDCCGVAVGVDRLMLLRHDATTLATVIPFDWTCC